MLASALVAAATAVALGCGGAHDDATAAAATSCRTGTYRLALTSAGRRRTVLVHVPGRAASAPLPLYLVLHYASGTGADMERASGMSALGDQRGFVAAYPDALPRSRPFWNATESKGKPDDVAFARDLIALLVRRGCADPERVYATGMSNGSSMDYLLACRLGDQIAGIGPIAGAYPTRIPCDPPRPLSVIEIHGTGDTVAPYAGRRGVTFSVPAFLAAWRERDNCPAKAVRSVPEKLATRFDWAPCKAGTRLAHVRLTGAGHGLPPNPPFEGKRSKFEASRAVVDFFSPAAP